MIKAKAPLTKALISRLRAGDLVSLTGTIYVARDQAHKKMLAALQAGHPLPIPIGALIYYAGPTPPKPGEVIGACGPTTASRMDEFTTHLIPYGYPFSIGKGQRSPAVRALLQEHQGIYFSAFGGCGALYQSRVLKARCLAYPELLSEAIYELEVQDFPMIVVIDSKGNDLFSPASLAVKSKK